MIASAPPKKTMFQKIWDQHVVYHEPDKQAIVYVDLQLVHEVTSPQAFEALRLGNRKVRRPELTVATPDHNVPTTDRLLPIADETSWEWDLARFCGVHVYACTNESFTLAERRSWAISVLLCLDLIVSGILNESG